MMNEHRPSKQALRPCPFCGSQAREFAWRDHYGCTDEQCGAFAANLTADQWNRRAADEPPAAQSNLDRFSDQEFATILCGHLVSTPDISERDREFLEQAYRRFKAHRAPEPPSTTLAIGDEVEWRGHLGEINDIGIVHVKFTKTGNAHFLHAADLTRTTSTKPDARTTCPHCTGFTDDHVAGCSAERSEKRPDDFHHYADETSPALSFGQAVDEYREARVQQERDRARAYKKPAGDT